MKRLISLATIMLAVLLTAAVAGAGTRGESDGGTTTPSIDTGSALVVLKGEPLATSEKTKPAHGKTIDFGSTAVKNYRSQLSALRNDFKQWLRANAPNAKVTGEFDISLNAVGVKLNGTTLGTLASAPMVASAEHQAVYRPLGHDDPDLDLVSAFEAWAAAGGTPAAKGDGVKVAIVDTGIDVTHPCFSDAGYASQQRQGPPSLTNNKVIVAKVFNNKSGSRGFTPEDVNGHGSHVAGTVACNEHTPANVDGVPVTGAPGGYAPSGVAPRALLGNYNVFPGDDANARSEDIVDALEEAYEDGFRIANMSLGGGSNGFNDLLARAVDNLDLANMVVAVAAGNSGPGFSTVESPGKAARALTAGASTVGHFIATPVTVGALTVGAAAGDFATVTGAPLTAPLDVVTDASATATGGLSTACSGLPANSLAGEIALISRGTCTFSAKIRNAEAAGAVATLVVNNSAGDPVAMAQDGTPNQPTKPAYMVSLADRTALMASDGASTTIPPTKQYLRTTNSDIRAAFSSEGPTDVDFRVKPDLMAPGVNVLSAQPAFACAAPPCWAFFQGTSMATPHLAGAAAVVRGQRPGWSAAQVRSAITNTADQNVIKSHVDGVTIVTNVNIVGAGRLNVFSAVTAKVALDPVSTTFGAVPGGSGQSLSRSITLSNLLGAGPYTAEVTNQTGAGVTFAATVSGNTITVTMTAVKGAAAGSRQGILRVRSGGTEVAHAAVYTFIK